MKHLLWCLLLLLPLQAQETYSPRPVIGLHMQQPRSVALVGATVVVSPDRIIPSATLLVRDGLVVQIGPGLRVPEGMLQIDVTGKRIYPAFIDLVSGYGLPEHKNPKSKPGELVNQAERGVGHWNPYVFAERRAELEFKADADSAAKLRAAGFGAVVSAYDTGLVQGQAALVLAAEDPRDEGEDPREMTVLKSSVFMGLTLDGISGDHYPYSKMGVIAFLRQIFSDAKWAASRGELLSEWPFSGLTPSLEALQPYSNGSAPVLIRAEEAQDVLRAADLASELQLNAMVLGAGETYRWAGQVAQNQTRLIVPLNFPKKPELGDPAKARNYVLRDLRHHILARRNALLLSQAGVNFAFTSSGLKDPAKFLPNLREVVAEGLDWRKALAALTVEPAKWIGADKKLGRLEPGYIANFLVVDGDLFDKKARLLETWVAGRPLAVEERPDHDLRGTWQLSLSAPNKKATLKLKGEPHKLSGSIEVDGQTIDLKKVSMKANRLVAQFPSEKLGQSGQIRFSALAGPQSMTGDFVWQDGWQSAFQGTRSGAANSDEEAKDEEKKPESLTLSVVYPEGAYGRSAPPEQVENLFVTGATIWTSGPQGVIENGQMHIQNGKIVAVGVNLRAHSGAQMLDATGRHITPGIIDAHSHIAISGSVNEATHAVTAEVRIADVVDAEDINIYRQLAGGVTMANLLHGSANPIGGQNAVIKFRWGAPPSELLFEDAVPGIKFALGENVKQANWGDDYKSRYPQSRMGVPELVRDFFQAARSYQAAWDAYRAKPGQPPPRRDFRMEALVEIMAGKRQVHCHSYRQDEILAMMRVAEEMGFRINVFTHILEGYKVADIMANHGAMGSTFSDWWRYKIEVHDAIPYNAALMHNQGIVVSLKSDSREMARRLNHEAAKAVKYGGVEPDVALTFVTLNPAKQLGIAERVGSLEPGKDADFVIWNSSPLSSMSHALETWIDGRKYFDRTEDLEQRKQVATQRNQLIQHLLLDDSAKKGGSAPPEPEKLEYHCEDFSREVLQ